MKRIHVPRVDTFVVLAGANKAWGASITANEDVIHKQNRADSYLFVGKVARKLSEDGTSDAALPNLVHRWDIAPSQKGKDFRLRDLIAIGNPVRL